MADVTDADIDEALKRVLTYKFAHLLQEVAVKEKGAAPLEKQKQLARRVQAIEQQAREVGIADLGLDESRQALRLGLRPQPIAHARLEPTRTPAPGGKATASAC